VVQIGCGSIAQVPLADVAIYQHIHLFTYLFIMVTRKPVPSRAVIPQGWQTPNYRSYAASSASTQETIPHPTRSKSPSTSPSFYEMNNAWADEAPERQTVLGNPESLHSLTDRRQSAGETRVREESLPSSLRIGPPDASQNKTEANQRFKSPRLQAELPTMVDVGEKQQYAEEPSHRTNPFNGIPRGTNSWQSIGSEDESLANIWREMETPPLESSKALPPPPLAGNESGVLVSIRAFANADVVAVS